MMLRSILEQHNGHLQSGVTQLTITETDDYVHHRSYHEKEFIYDENFAKFSTAFPEWCCEVGCTEIPVRNISEQVCRV